MKKGKIVIIEVDEMPKNKFEVCLNREDGSTSCLNAKSISPTKAASNYNELARPSFDKDAHEFKCFDNFEIQDEASDVKQVSFSGEGIQQIVFKDGRTLYRADKISGDFKCGD